MRYSARVLYNSGVSIQEIFSNIKQSTYCKDVLLGSLLIAVGVVSFILGRVSAGEAIVAPTGQKSIVIEVKENMGDTSPSNTLDQTPTSLETGEGNTEGVYVGSKNGTKYHLPWCSGAKRIKEENKVWFLTKEEAEAAGYTPAANCEGI
jgi:hypothetical protein